MFCNNRCVTRTCCCGSNYSTGPIGGGTITGYLPVSVSYTVNPMGRVGLEPVLHQGSVIDTDMSVGEYSGSPYANSAADIYFRYPGESVAYNDVPYSESPRLRSGCCR